MIDLNKISKMGLITEQFFGARVKDGCDEGLVDLIRKTLETDISLDFLLELRTRELETLAACIRDRIGLRT